MDNQNVDGVIGMACGEIARFSECYASLMGMEKPANTRFLQCKSMSVARNFNEIAREMLKTSAQWLFLTNDDHLYPPDTLMRLLAHDVDVVGGLYVARTFPFAPVIHDSVAENGLVFPRYLQPHEKGLVPIKATGDGCLLIRRRVIEAIPDPWWELGKPISETCAHDVLFSKKVLAAGFQIYADLDTIVGHLGVFAICPHRDNTGNWLTLIQQQAQALVVPAATAPRNPYSMIEGS